MIIIVFTIIISFLWGSIPKGHLNAKKFKGIDIRTNCFILDRITETIIKILTEE